MRVKYAIQFKSPVSIDDHWPIPLLGGECRIVSEAGQATGLEVTFTGQPVTLAPKVERVDRGKVKFSITERDTLMPQLERRLRGALAFLQCFFRVNLAINETEVSYEPETDEERGQIEMFGVKPGKAEHPPTISFDFFTRALLAAEHGAPAFEASSVQVARQALAEDRYIDAFRYAFLLIEAFYGEGKFKTDQLQAAFKASDELKRFVAATLKEPIPPRRKHGSATEKLLAANPSAEDVLDHLVDQRGFYFHGNVKRPNAWQQHEQDAAEALALLALEIAMQISHKGAEPMFEDAYAQAHYNTAVKAGAIMSLQVRFRFRQPDEKVDRNGVMNITIPGTMLTPRMAFHVVQQFLADFECDAPTATLRDASCSVNGTNEKVFDLVIHVPASSVVPNE